MVPVQVHLLASPSPGIQGRQATKEGDIGELRPAERKAPETANTVGLYVATELSFYFSLEMGSGLAAALGVCGEQGLERCAQSQVSVMSATRLPRLQEAFSLPSAEQWAEGTRSFSTAAGRSLLQAAPLRLRPRSCLSSTSP